MPHVNTAEAKVADALRAAGIGIQCNVFIDNYEVDIVVENHLVIEVDGYHHYARNNMRRDASKEQHLLEAGFRLLRIRNADVHDQTRLRAFVEQVKNELSKRPGADIPANTPLASPLMQQLKDQLTAREQAKQQAAVKRQRPGQPPLKKNDRTLFLEWLEREPLPEEKDDDNRGKRSRR